MILCPSGVVRPSFLDLFEDFELVLRLMEGGKERNILLTFL